MKRSNFLRASAILTASAVGTKLLGALFKLPLTNLLGGTGMGYFSTAYGLFLPLYAVLVTGLSTAVARPVAFYTAQHRQEAAADVRRMAGRVFCAAGLAGSIAAALLARRFTVQTAGNADAVPAVLAIAPAVLLCCLTAVERGYYEGLCRMLPTALSQLAEAAVKLGAGLYLCRRFMLRPPAVLAGCTPEAAGACGAVLGVTIGALAGYLLMLACRIREPALPRSTVPARVLLRELLGIMIPAALGALVTNLTSLIDLVTVMRSFSAQIAEDPAAFYRNARVPEGIPPEKAAAFVYGSFMGLSVTVFNLVPSLTNMLAKGVLPCAAQAWGAGDRKAAAGYAREVLLLTGLAAIPAGCALTVLAGEVLRFLFAGREDEIAAAVPSLQALAPGLIGLCLTFPVFSLLQAVGREDLPVKLLLPGALVKLIGNLLLLPRLHAAGAALSTGLCYGVILTAALVCLRRVLGEKIGVGRCLAVQGFSGMLCAAAAWVACTRLQCLLPQRPAFLLAACIGAGVYATGIVCLKGMRPGKV